MATRAAEILLLSLPLINLLSVVQRRWSSISDPKVFRFHFLLKFNLEGGVNWKDNSGKEIESLVRISKLELMATRQEKGGEFETNTFKSNNGPEGQMSFTLEFFSYLA